MSTHNVISEYIVRQIPQGDNAGDFRVDRPMSLPSTPSRAPAVPCNGIPHTVSLILFGSRRTARGEQIDSGRDPDTGAESGRGWIDYNSTSPNPVQISATA